MKCPVCGAWTEVKESRLRLNNTRFRRYECANEHRFSTREIVERVDEQKPAPSTGKKRV